MGFSATAEQRELFESVYLSRKPLSSNKKNGVYRRRRRVKALEHAYIETNPFVMQSLVITDRDLADTDWAAELAGLPAPTYTALNPDTGTGHIVYGLKHPVCLSDAARRRPVNLLARIEHGLNTVLEGDPGYGGRITKNPLNAQHLTLWGEAFYTLHELAKALDEIKALPSAGNPTKNVQTSAVGRNVALFDYTRQWAYRAVRRHFGGPYSDWETAVFAYAWEKNETIIADEFTKGPMSANQVTTVTRSVAKWVWRNFTPETWTARQSYAGRQGGIKSGQKRRAAAEERRKLILENR